MPLNTGELPQANRKTAKPPPTTTTHRTMVYLYTRIENDRTQLAKLRTHT